MSMASSGSCHRRSRSSYSSCQKLKIGFIGEKNYKNKKWFQKYQKATIKKLFWKSSKKKQRLTKTTRLLPGRTQDLT